MEIYRDLLLVIKRNSFERNIYFVSILFFFSNLVQFGLSDITDRIRIPCRDLIPSETPVIRKVKEVRAWKEKSRDREFSSTD